MQKLKEDEMDDKSLDIGEDDYSKTNTGTKNKTPMHNTPLNFEDVSLDFSQTLDNSTCVLKPPQRNLSVSIEQKVEVQLDMHNKSMFASKTFNKIKITRIIEANFEEDSPKSGTMATTNKK